MPEEYYQHFKGDVCQVIAVAKHSETLEDYVVYRELNQEDQVYVRPYEMFISKVEKEKYPQVTQEYRFEYMPQGYGVDQRLLQFLDADTMEDKLKVLRDIGDEMTDRLVDDFAASLDLIIEEGPIENRVAQLRYCMSTRNSYETNRFR